MEYVKSKIYYNILKILDSAMYICYYNQEVITPSYFVAIVSENTEEQIREYLQKQKRKWGEDSGKGL